MVTVHDAINRGMQNSRYFDRPLCDYLLFIEPLQRRPLAHYSPLSFSLKAMIFYIVYVFKQHMAVYCFCRNVAQ